MTTKREKDFGIDTNSIPIKNEGVIEAKSEKLLDFLYLKTSDIDTNKPFEVYWSGKAEFTKPDGSKVKKIYVENTDGKRLIINYTNLKQLVAQGIQTLEDLRGKKIWFTKSKVSVNGQVKDTLIITKIE